MQKSVAASSHTSTFHIPYASYRHIPHVCSTLSCGPLSGTHRVSLDWQSTSPHHSQGLVYLPCISRLAEYLSSPLLTETTLLEPGDLQ